MEPEEQEESDTPLTDKEWNDLSYDVSKVFTPASPINEEDLFAGRWKEIKRVIDAINQPGQHATKSRQVAVRQCP